DNAILVAVLVKAKREERQAENSFKKDVWTEVAAKVKAKGVNRGAKKIYTKCHNHFSNMKADFKEVDGLAQKSGFGWDDELKMVVASEMMWKNELSMCTKLIFLFIPDISL
ncbi:hypothetical protein Moror_6239, partial [Moniliophthora roreri MCA 2997]